MDNKDSVSSESIKDKSNDDLISSESIKVKSNDDLISSESIKVKSDDGDLISSESKNDKANLSSSKSKYSLNFSFSQKRLVSKDEDIFDEGSVSNVGMSSGVISETSLENDHILLRKRSLLQRKSRGSLKIFYSEIIDLKLVKSDLSSLYSSIKIVYSKNGYSKHLISLSSSDGFAVRWFYDELVVRYSLKKADLEDSNILKSNENDFLEKGNDLGQSSNLDDFGSADDLGQSSNLDDFSSADDLHQSSNLDDFMNQMNAEISEKRKRKISKQMKFDRCSSGEY